MPKKFNLLSRHAFIAFLLAFFSLTANSQRKVQGKVTGPDSKSVFGATVSVKGTNIATSTSTDGTYSIQLPTNSNTLVFSYVGYEVSEVNAQSNSVIDVVMKLQATSLNEVVVTGYSSQRKKDITGAVTVVNVADMKSQPAIDAGSQLQGRASGVTVVQNGVPGASSTVRIRGLGSFNNNNPLYVIDGVQSGSITGLNPNDIESMQVLKDAASASIYGVRASNGVIIVTTKKGKRRGVSVMYDGYYGFQDPGNGPKGESKLLNAQEAAELYFLAQKNSGLPTTGTVYGNGATPVLPDYIYFTGAANNGTPIMAGNAGVDPSKYSLDYGRLGDAGYNPYYIVPASKNGTNWYNVITRNAPIQNHNLTLSGSNDNSRFLVSLNYYDQKAITEWQFYKRYSARVNSEFNLIKNIRVGENIQIFSSEANVPGGGDAANNTEGSQIAETYRSMAIIPVYTIMPGDFAGNKGGYGPDTWGNGKNPLGTLYRQRNNRSNNINIFGNVYAEVDIAKHFTARSSFGGAINTNNSFSYPYIEYENNENTGNTTYSESFARGQNWIWTNTLAYKNIFRKHNISVIAGEEAQKGSGRQVNGAASGYFAYNYQPYINLSNGGTQNLGGSSIYTPGTTLSYFANANYEYDGKYLLSATIRRDGSSKFQDPNKWGNFPAFSLGWRISEESFMKNISWINDLKIRGSWGKMGNEAAVSASNAFTTFASSSQSSYYDIAITQNNPASGFFLNFVGNPLGQWERSVNTNIGFDATLFHNSTEIVFDWYIKKTQGLLYNPAGQAIAGAVAANNPSFRNVGSMENHGIDLMITNKKQITKDIKLTSTGTLTTYKNKIQAITLDGQPFFDFNSPINEQNRIGANATRNFAGQALNTYYGYKVIGLFQTTAEAAGWNQTDAAPGRFKYADINGDKKIDANDRTIIGNPNPKFTYGLNLDASYKAFDLGLFFYGVAGKDAFNFTKWWTDFTPATFPGGRSRRALYDSWLPDGSRPNATTPIQEAANGTGFSSNQAVNSYYVENASYFRLRNLQLGYSLPSSLTSKVNISKVRIYIQGTNLFTITKYSGLDPDIISTDDRGASLDVGAYPTVKQFLIGANITF